jgi:hypothetical protein
VYLLSDAGDLLSECLDGGVVNKATGILEQEVQGGHASLVGVLASFVWRDHVCHELVSFGLKGADLLCDACCRCSAFGKPDLSFCDGFTCLEHDFGLRGAFVLQLIDVTGKPAHGNMGGFDCGCRLFEGFNA